MRVLVLIVLVILLTGMIYHASTTPAIVFAFVGMLFVVTVWPWIAGFWRNLRRESRPITPAAEPPATIEERENTPTG